jgi:alanine racemase
MDITAIHRPTYLEIDLDAISDNYRTIKSVLDHQKVLWVLKANAYGHGLIRIAQHLESLGSDYFGVAYLEEGISLRNHGIVTPILVLGGISGYQLPQFISHDLTITASSVDKLNQINDCAKAMSKTAKVHLNIDTGMERIGIHHYNAAKLITAAKNAKYCRIEGIYTHMANADLTDDQYTAVQKARFETVLKDLEKQNLDISIVHAANSATALKEPTLRYDMVRCGLLLYGLYPNQLLKRNISVRPALTWKSRVVFFKVIPENTQVSYGGKWRSHKMTRIVTLPVGYGDGYMRALSNKAEVLIRGKRYPVVGNISMDQMMVDISWETAYNDDEVILIGRQGNQEISVEDLAQSANTISYEILTNINNRVPRVYLHS